MSDRIEMERKAARRVDDELRTVLDDGGKVSGITTVRVMGGDWTTVEGLLERAYQAGRADATDEIVARLERDAKRKLAAAERVWADREDEEGMAFLAIGAGVLEREAERLKPVEPPVAPPIAVPLPTRDERFVEQYPGMADLVRRDQQEVVYPRGVAKVVPRGVCRCPILDVGDFCPVHGG